MISSQKLCLISPKILEFYKVKESEEGDNISVFFQANGAFNPKRIVEHIWSNLKSDEVLKDLENYTYEDYLQCCQKLLPIFHYTNKIIKNLNEYHDSYGNIKMRWMGCNVNSYLDMKNSYNNIATQAFEHTLILTSLLANGLTNVYLSQTKGKHAPHLLKDLINSSEIVHLFGVEMIILLKVLMGSPRSINLRNIVWHGFPKPMEVPNYYVNVLLIIIHSLGCIIETKKIQTKDRNQITNFNEHINLIKQDFQFKTMELTYMIEKLQEFKNDFVIYWQQLLLYYESQKYKEFIVFVLPQIELLLRLNYGTVNNCDVSAKLDEFYITMDTIFNTKVTCGDKVQEYSNKLLDFENSMFEGYFHFLYDVFISPSGCRLRDKVSHGEVYLEALDNFQLCSVVLHAFLALLFPEEFKVFENYESKLHLNSITKVNLVKSFEKLKVFHKNLFENNQEFASKPVVPEHHKVLIFKRPKKESELMLILYKIADNIYKTVHNYEEALDIRCTLLAKRELHSKRRKTLEKLKCALPDISKTLISIISVCSKIFKMLQDSFTHVLQNKNDYNKTLRFLKRCLTISENFVKYSHYENNEWIKSMELCREYNEFHKNLFLYGD